MLPRPLFQSPISIFHLVTQGHPRNHQPFLIAIVIESSDLKEINDHLVVKWEWMSKKGTFDGNKWSTSTGVPLLSTTFIKNLDFMVQPVCPAFEQVHWWAWHPGMTRYPSIFAFLVFPLRRWLTMMHGTDAMLHVSCTSPRDHERAQCSIFVKSLLLATPLFSNV